MNRYHTKPGGNYIKTVKRLAEDLSKHFGEEFEVLGPFGLRSHFGLRSEHYHLGVNAEINNDLSVDLSYDTDEILDRYAHDTIGALNGFNIVTKPLPVTLDDIVKLVSVWRE